jgi:hypothetical protein
MILRIRNWSEIYENNRTKELRRMEWVPMPNRMDGSGYTELLDHEDGAAHFGAWVALVEIASRCEPRGTLVRDSRRNLRECRTDLRDCRMKVRDGVVPHDSKSLSRISRISSAVFDDVIPRLLSIGWLEEIDLTDEMSHEGAGLSQEGAATPQEPAVIPQEGAASRARRRARDERNGMERKGTEGNGREEAAAETLQVSVAVAEEPPPPTVQELKNQLRIAAAVGKPQNGSSEPEDRATMQSRLERYEWTRAALAEYPGTQRLPGKPDDTIIRRCLEIAHNDTDTLSRSLESMYRAGKAPSLSWAWFPTVLAQYVDGS